MSQDTKEITTPTGRKVVIRNHTTRGDDKQASELLNEGITITTGPDGEAVVSVTAAASAASTAKYVELLVRSIDGKTDNIPALLDELHSEDYKAVEAAVLEITAVDPKAASKS